MKPASIIFLIVSVLLVIGGLTASGVAKQLAISEGIVLVDSVSESGEDKVLVHEYSESEIGRINVSVKDVDVNIIGGADRPYIELINFPDGMYEFSSSNRVIEISNSSGGITFSGIASTIANFKGLRSFVSYYNMSKTEQTVNIYLCDANPVTRIECSVDGGDVTVKNNTTATDYYLSAVDGSINVSGIKTVSAVNFELDGGELIAEGLVASKLTASVGTGAVKLSGFAEKNDIKITSGDIVYDYYSNSAYTNMSLIASVGTVTVDGERFGGIREQNDTAIDRLIKIEIGTGDVIINSHPEGIN